MYLGVCPTISGFSADGSQFSLILDENPMIEFVELPEHMVKGGLQYSSVIVGLIRGALEMLHVQVECALVKCTLLNPADRTEITVKFVKMLEEEIPPADF